MRKTGYRQCALQRAEGAGVCRVVSFLPEKYAAVGHVLRLRDHRGQWSDGWVVCSVGARRDEVPDWRKGIRGHRLKTGDALPRMSKKNDG